MIAAHLICIASALPSDASALESAISALESAITTLDNSSAFWERLLPWFTGFVVAGVVAEVWVVCLDHRDAMDAWRRGIIRPPGRPSHRRFWVEVVASSAIALGVACELWAGVAIARINGQLRSRNAELRTKTDQFIALLNTEAGDANERAGKAEERVAELLQEIQPRRLSPDQEKNIADLLKSYAGKIVSVATYHQDAEAMILAAQIEEALRKANILVWDRIGTFGAMGMPLYLGVTVDTNSSDKKLASALCKALGTKGGLATGNAAVMFGQGSTMWLPPSPKLPPDRQKTSEDAFVFVGEKPIADALTPTAETRRAWCSE